jgi:hypothetical protein
MAPSSLSRRRRRPPRCAVGARSLNSNRCHVDNRRVRPAKWYVYGRHVYKLLLEVPAQRQHVRVARPTLKAFNQEQGLTAVHSWPLLDLGRGTAAVQHQRSMHHRLRSVRRIAAQASKLL